MGSHIEVEHEAALTLSDPKFKSDRSTVTLQPIPRGGIGGYIAEHLATNPVLKARRYRVELPPCA